MSALTALTALSVLSVLSVAATTTVAATTALCRLPRLIGEPQRQADALTLHVDLHDLDLDDLAGTDDLVRVVDPTFGHRRDVDQAVLVDSHIHEGTEGGDIGHRALQHHARGEVGDLLDALGQRCGPELGTRVTARLVQLGEHVGDGGHAEGLVGEVRRTQPRQHPGVADELAHTHSGALGDPTDQRIGLRVHRGGVQRVGRAVDTQEAGALLEGLRSQPGDVLELTAGGERAVGLTVVDDVLREGGGHSCDPAQQRSRGGVDVHTDGVHGVLHDAVETVGEHDLVDIVLVLADTDGLRVDLHQFGQRILEPAGDGHRTTQRDVHVGELLGGELGGGVDRGTGLGDDDGGRTLTGGRGDLLRDLAGQLLGLPGRGAVAHGHEVDAVLRADPGEDVDGLVPPVLRLVRVDDDRVEDLAGRVDGRTLHTVVVPGVQAQGRTLTGGRGEQQVTQVTGEDIDRPGVRLLLETHAHVHTGGDLQLRAPTEADALGAELVGGVALRLQATGAGDHALVDRVLAGVEGELEDALGFTAQQREDAVGRQCGEGLGELEVVTVLLGLGGVLLPLDDAGGHRTGGVETLAHLADQVRVGGDLLQDDGARAGEYRLRVIESLGDVGRRQLGGIGGAVAEQRLDQRLQARLTGDRRLGASGGLERQVQVLQAGLGLTAQDEVTQFVGELALLLDRGEDGGLAGLQFPQVGQPGLEGAQLGIVETAGDLLAVAGDEGHGVALIEQVHGGRHLRLGDPEFPGDRPDHCCGRLSVVLTSGHSDHCSRGPEGSEREAGLPCCLRRFRPGLQLRFPGLLLRRPVSPALRPLLGVLPGLDRRVLASAVSLDLPLQGLLPQPAQFLDRRIRRPVDDVAELVDGHRRRRGDRAGAVDRGEPLRGGPQPVDDLAFHRLVDVAAPVLRRRQRMVVLVVRTLVVALTPPVVVVLLPRPVRNRFPGRLRVLHRRDPSLALRLAFLASGDLVVDLGPHPRVPVESTPHGVDVVDGHPAVGQGLRIQHRHPPGHLGGVPEPCDIGRPPAPHRLFQGRPFHRRTVVDVGVRHPQFRAVERVDGDLLDGRMVDRVLVQHGWAPPRPLPDRPAPGAWEPTLAPREHATSGP